MQSTHIGPPDSDEFDIYRMRVPRVTTWTCWQWWAAVRARALPRGWRQIVYLHPAGPRLAVTVCSDDGTAPSWQPIRRTA